MKRFYPISLILIMFLVLTVSGCETVPKKFREEVSGIKTRVETLETRVDTVEAKQVETERAAGEQADVSAERRGRAKTNIGVKAKNIKGRERTREIQLCLKNAGFYDGKIDGVKGKNTRRAIREFQKANGLKADGIVGKKTWELLGKYGQISAEAEGGSGESIGK